MTPKLSILIPSLIKRSGYLLRLMEGFRTQLNHVNEVEILVNVDNGKKSIGQKRNELLQQATGDYVVFIDDDDEISTVYLLEIFEGIEKGVDHIGIQMMYMPDKGVSKLVKCSKDYAWEEKDGVYLRSAQHVCAIKRSIATQVKFPEISFGEDKTWSETITKLVETEHLVSEPIYFYRYRSQKND